MKKILSIAFVLTFVFALSIAATATGTLYSEADHWFYNAETAGTLTAKDAQLEYGFTVDAGNNFLGAQSNFYGKLVFVDFEPADGHVCKFVKNLVGAEVDATITKVTGNKNPYAFVITEEYEWVCECGEKAENTFESIEETIRLANNYKGLVTVGEYIICIASSGNITVDDIYVVW